MAARLAGINHVALEVADVERSLAFYRQLFTFTLRGRGDGAAFIDIGDQFIALMEAPPRRPDTVAHAGLVVDDKEAVRRALAVAGAEPLPGHRLDVLDPDGNRIEVVQYDEVQFTKAPLILERLGLSADKTESALAELRAKGLA